MNDRKSSLPDGSGQDKGGGAPVSLSRRRFAKGAAPVVLGTLVSTPVLGAAPYHCTVSGHVSGDASPRADAAGTGTCALGKSRTFWLENDWEDLEVVPELVKGTSPSVVPTGNPPVSQCSFTSGTTVPTLFNGFGSGVVAGGLTATFFYISEGTEACKIVTSDSAATPASLYQVLAAVGDDQTLELGRVTVVSLLNYYADPGGYPVTAARIMHMFNETYNDGTYDFNATVKWSRSQVVKYLSSLYPAG